MSALCLLDDNLKTILRSALILAVSESGGNGIFSEDEIEELVNKYHHYLLALLRFKTGNDEVAKELLQETYLSFLGAVSKSGSRRKFQNESKIKNYLITIALNKVKNHYKKSSVESRRRKVFSSNEEMDACFEKISDSGGDSADLLVAEEREQQIKAATQLTMERISERYRIALDYKFTRGLDNKEIAERMNIGIKAAESILFRAKAAFRKEFRKIAVKENGFFDGGIDLY